MLNVLRIVGAFAVAPLLPTFLLILYSGRTLPVVVLVSAYRAALVVGVPTYLVMRRFGATRLKHFLLYGFLVFGLLAFAFSVRSYSGVDGWNIGGVAVVEAGRLTAAGWLQCAYCGAVIGVTAALGGAIFWAMTQWNVFSGTTRLAAALPMGVLFVAANVLAFRSIDWSPYDPTALGCHAGGIGPTRRPSIDLQISESEWPELTAIFEQVARDFGLSYRDSSKARPGVLRLLYLSMCKDSKFQVMINEQRWATPSPGPPRTRGVGIAFYARTDDEEWKAVANALLVDLEERWGDRVRFIDGSGYVIPKPDDLFQ